MNKLIKNVSKLKKLLNNRCVEFFDELAWFYEIVDNCETCGYAQIIKNLMKID